MVYFNQRKKNVWLKCAGLISQILVMFIFGGVVDNKFGVQAEHGDLGTVSFHLRRKTKMHGHTHKHSRYHNRSHFQNSFGRSKDGYSLRVSFIRICIYLLSCLILLV